MPENTQTPVAQPNGQPSIQDHINGQKQALVNKAQEIINASHNIIDSWVHNFMMSEKVKNKRTEQVNMLLGFINQIANEGHTAINEIGIEIKDPSISNRVLECNNTLMTAARNVLEAVKKQEEDFQNELKNAMMQAQAQVQAQASSGPKTEVKAQEA
jgi:hypothetical protein